MDKSIMQSLSYRLSHDFCSAHWTRFFSPTSFFLLSDHLNKKWNGLVVVLCAPQTHWLKYFLISILAYMAASGSQFSCLLVMGSIWNDKWHFFSPFFLLLLSFYSPHSPIIWTRNETIWWLFYVFSKTWVEIYSEWVFLFYPYCLFVHLTLKTFVQPIQLFFFLLSSLYVANQFSSVSCCFKHKK